MQNVRDSSTQEGSMTHRKSQTCRKGVDLMHNLMWYILTEDQRPTLERELGMDQKSS
jgi:hypothetical protein